MKSFTLLSFILAAGLVFTACKKDKSSDDQTSAPASTTGTVKLSFTHLWEGNAFMPAEENTYINSSTNDTLNFTMFRYYISNVRLKKADGSFYAQPESYFIVNANNPASSIITLSNVPAGDYTDVYFTFGVDSTRNVSGAQTGALDPSNGMFWSWSTGYIMSKAEGLSPNASTGSFAFHLGGFHGTNSVVSEKQISLLPAGSLSLSAAATKQVFVDVAVEKMWASSPSLSVVSDLQSPGAAAKAMALSFLTGITLNHIQ